MIKVTCPNCERTLSVADTMAGKKGKCPTCKTMLTVPGNAGAAPPKSGSNGSAPPKIPAPSAHELEALAAAALADEPPPEQEEPKFIDFECPMCGEKLKMDTALCGKRAPCPECRRIIKIPELAKREKKDWRQLNDGLPLGARRPDQPAPEGAWGSVNASTVNKGALEDAGILRVARPPLTVGQKITRGLIVAGVLVLLGVGYWLVADRFATSREQRMLKTATDYVGTPEAPAALGREGLASLRCLVGQYYLRSHLPDPAAKAKKELDSAVSLLQDPAKPNKWGLSERDLVLGEIALAQTELGGSQDEVDKGERVSFEDAHKSFRAALDAIQLPEARREAFRAVAQRLKERGQESRVTNLANQVFPAAEKEDALNLANIVTGAQKVEWMQLKPELRLIGLLSAVENAKSDNTAIDAALKWVAPELKMMPELAWSLPRLIELAAQAGQQDDSIKAVLEDIKDPVLHSRAQLALARGKMAREKKVTEEDAFAAVDAKSLERLLGQAALFRNNVKLDEGWLKKVEGLSEPAKSYASIGAALGLQKD